MGRRVLLVALFLICAFCLISCGSSKTRLLFSQRSFPFPEAYFENTEYMQVITFPTGTGTFVYGFTEDGLEKLVFMTENNGSWHEGQKVKFRLIDGLHFSASNIIARSCYVDGEEKCLVELVRIAEIDDIIVVPTDNRGTHFQCTRKRDSMGIWSSYTYIGLVDSIDEEYAIFGW